MNLGRVRWLTVIALSLGISMIIVDATIVNVAIPSAVPAAKPVLADAWPHQTPGEDALSRRCGTRAGSTAALALVRPNGRTRDTR
jgi:hypothetical protein